MADPAPWRTILLAEVGSTNRLLLEVLGPLARPGLVVVADHQREGRGRLDRHFVDIARTALAVSVLVDCPLPPGLLPAAIGVASVTGLRSLGVEGVGLKWPNDLVSPAGKLGGVLIEAKGSLVVAGLGMNLTSAPRGVGAVALTEVWPGGPGTEFVGLRRDVLGAYLEALRDVLWRPPVSVLEAYRRMLVTLGSRVRIERREGEVVGLALDVDADGRLLVALEQDVVAVAVGDVVHLRPLQ